MNGNQTLHLPSITLNYKALNTTTTANLLSLNKLSPLFPFVPLEHYISTGAESFVVFLWEVAISFGSHSTLRYQTFLSLDLGDIVSERHASTQISVVVVIIIIIIIIFLQTQPISSIFTCLCLHTQTGQDSRFDHQVCF